MKKIKSLLSTKAFLIGSLCISAFTIQAQNFQWARSIGGTQSDEGRSITLDASGNVITLGVFQSTIDLDPGVGTSTVVAAGVIDVFISKLRKVFAGDESVKIETLHGIGFKLVVA